MLRQVVLSVLLLAAVPVAAVEPVALVTELSGKGRIGAQGRSTPLELLQDLVPGSSVTLSSGARAVIVHTANGIVYEVLGPGSFRVSPKSVDAVESTARITRRELPPDIRAYRLDPTVAAQASIVMRGGEIRLDGPDGGVLDESELRYRVGGAVREAQLDVFDERGSGVVHIDSAEVDGFDLKGRYAWVPGERYSVQVTGIDAKGRAVTLRARFQLVPPEAVARLRAQEPKAATPTTDWVVYALALESVGANATARPIWRKLQTAR
jgi:hypothetical protein